MTHRGKRGFAWLCAAMALIGWAAQARADDISYINGACRKLGRGLSNVVTCPLELVRTPTIVGRREGNLAALSIGLVEGLARTLGRGVTGIFEIVTFYAEIPKNFEPLMKPEFVWARGDWVD